MPSEKPVKKSATTSITREDLIKGLQEDLSREYQAIMAYVVYSQALKGAQYQSIAKELDVVVHVIGLGNFTGAPELELLNRVANSPASPVHDPTKPIGLMIYANDAGELEAAFAQVGSEMLRLSM